MPRDPGVLRALADAAVEGADDADQLLGRLCQILANGFGLERVSFLRAGDTPEGSDLALPLVAGGQFVGVLTAGVVPPLEDEDLELLRGAAAFVTSTYLQARELERLRRAGDLGSQFIALASHELRNPAAVVYGISSTLHHRGDELTAEQLYDLRRTLHDQSERMCTLVNQLLDLSRLEANAIRIAPERLPVRTRVEEIVLLTAAERAREVELDIPAALETVADAEAFDRIVSNLVANALRYGDAPVRVAAEQSDRHFRLTVEDAGRGVAPEFVPRLFERFTRSNDSAPSTGSGLGLAIAKSYANAHGGDLFYEPAQPHGARFQLVLPTLSR